MSFAVKHCHSAHLCPLRRPAPLSEESFKIELATAVFRRGCPSYPLTHEIIPKFDGLEKLLELGAMWSFQRLEPAVKSSLLGQEYALFLTGSATNQKTILNSRQGIM